ncbi:MAG: hypothetical protein EBZ59_12205 [Planctomycetia bacterium]|nr:hypothetical protein [Planctomycetia bacterium]
MNRPRFLADHDLNEHIIAGVLRLCPGVEFHRVRDGGLADAPDREVLLHAAQAGLCVVSHDVNTMTAAAADIVRAGGSFPGLILVKQTTPVRLAIDSLALVWSASEQSDWRNLVVFLPL